MKWGDSRRYGRRLWRSWVPILLVVAVGLSALAGGPSGRIPSALADYGETSVVSGLPIDGQFSYSSTLSSMGARWVDASTFASWNTYTYHGGQMSSWTSVFSFDGVTTTQASFMGYYYFNNSNASDAHHVVYGVGLSTNVITPAMRNDGLWHTLSWTSGVVHLWSGSPGVTVGAGSITFHVPAVGDSTWYTWGTWGMVPLAVSISGPGVVNTDDSHTWTATGSGGTGPYTYKWVYGATGPFFTYPYSGASFSSKLAQGTWTLECQVTDSIGATAIGDIQVQATPGFSGAGYQITLTRSGAAGTSLTADARNVVNGLVASISNSASSKVAWYTSTVPSTFTWYNLMAEGSSGTAFGWLWSLIVSGTPPIPAPPDTWFSSIITVNGIQMTVVHHFVNINEIATLWFDAAGNCLNPETPPVSGVVIPDWLKPLIDFLTYLFAPVIFVFQVIKSVIEFAVGLIAYISYVMGIVLSFAGLLAQWLYVAVTTVFNFASASPGAYVSIGGLLSLVGFGSTGISGDISVFKGVGISPAAMDTGLMKIHDWIMAPSVAWVWWAIFTFLLLRLVLNLGHSDDEGGGE